LTTCTAANINTAISQAANGDTILLTCTGTVDWTSTITIPNTKGLTVKVENGSNTPKSSPSLPLTITSTANPLIYINCENGLFSRVSGFRFTTSGNPTNGAINVRGRGAQCFRIDNNVWEGFQFSHNDLEGVITVGGRGSGTYNNAGSLNGLIDNNTFRNSGYADGYVIHIREPWQFGGSGFSFSGRNAWTRPFIRGDADYTFIEDNLFENLAVYARHFIVGISGAKYVTRYNTFISNVSGAGVTEQVDAHGHCICDSIGHGTRGGEIYGNTFGGTAVNAFCLLRGGTWLVYDNVFTSTPDQAYMELEEYRAKNSGDCTSSCPGDPNWDATIQGQYPASWPASEQIGADFSPTPGVAPNTAPSYFWNNVRSGQGNQAPVVENAGATRSYIQFNREIFHSAARPDALSSYVPFPYPHPLRGATPSAPAAPTSLTIR
jgi:hypothetical protein